MLRRLTLAALVLLLAPPALAQEPARARADALFKQGRQAATTGDYAAACAAFLESQRLDPSVGTLVNLGDCESHLGHLVQARNYFRAALAQLGAGDPRYPVARDAIAKLDADIPTLTIERRDASLQIVRDGVRVGDEEIGVPVPLDVGEHAIEVTTPGKPPMRVSVTLAKGDRRSIAVEPDKSEPDKAEKVPEARTETVRPFATLGWISIGVGLAGVAAAIGTGVAVLDARSTVAARCDTTLHTCADQKAIDVAKNGPVWVGVNAVAWAVAIAGVGLGVPLVLVKKTRLTSSAAVVVAPTSAALRVTF